MAIIRDIKRGVLGLGLLLLGGLSTSCNRNNEPKLQQFLVVNVQMSRFALSMEGEAALSAIPFSIDNTAPEGVVENIEPLPYGVKLDKVRLVITPAAGATKVAVSVDGGSWQEWKATDEYQLDGEDRSLRVRLTFGEDDATKYEYIYKVKLNKYKFDPETIEWTSQSVGGTAPSVGGGYSYALTRAEDVFYLNSGTAGTSYRSVRGEQFAPLVISGLSAGETILQATAYEQRVYIYTSRGRVCRLDGQSWTEVAVGAKVKALLGLMPPRQAGQEPRLALIVEEGGRDVFASYASGRLSTRHQAVPKAFPRVGTYAFSATKPFVGPSLTLVGETVVDGVPTQSTWYTTDLAEDWLLVAQTERPDRQGAKPSTTLELGGVLYRLETVGGLSLYTSADQGKTWRKNSDKALPESWQSLSGREIFAYRALDNTIHLLDNVSIVSAGGGSLLRGRPKKHDL